jgi:hypothetical protein
MVAVLQKTARSGQAEIVVSALAVWEPIRAHHLIVRFETGAELIVREHEIGNARALAKSLATIDKLADRDVPWVLVVHLGGDMLTLNRAVLPGFTRALEEFATALRMEHERLPDRTYSTRVELMRDWAPEQSEARREGEK